MLMNIKNRLTSKDYWKLSPVRREHRLRHGSPAAAAGCHCGGDDALPQRLPETLRPGGGCLRVAVPPIGLRRGLPFGAVGGGARGAPGGRLPTAGRVDQQRGTDGAEAPGALRGTRGAGGGGLGGSPRGLPQERGEPEVHGIFLTVDLRPELLEFSGA